MTWQWPTNSTVITTAVSPEHPALDIAAPIGTPIIAPVSGRVERIVRNEPSGYGNLVILRTDSGHRVFLAHMSKFPNDLRGGQRVTPGQLVGYVGSSGRSTGPHLHLEIRDRNNRPVSPLAFFQGLQNLAQPRPGINLPAAARSNRVISGRPVSNTGRPVSGSPVATRPIPVSAATRPQQPGQLTISTPAGPVSLALPKIAWASVGLIGGGLVLMLISLAALLRKRDQSKLELAKQIAPAVAMAAGPEASAAVGAVLAAEKAGTDKQKAQAAGKGLKAIQKAQAKKVKAETQKVKAETRAIEKPAAPVKPELPPEPTSKQRRLHRPFQQSQ